MARRLALTALGVLAVVLTTTEGGRYLKGQLVALDAQQAEVVVYRINAGGPAVAGTPTWVADTTATPSPYVNAAATGNKVYTTGVAVSATHPSIPPGTPASLFPSERYVIAGGPTMQWDVPVNPGTYEVRLYFAEIYFNTTGARIFNVSIEGTPVLQNYDIVADVGPFTGVVKSFVVTADTNLDIDLSRVTENPKINAIEIVDATGTPGTLASMPSSLAFGSVPVGQTKPLTVQLTNAGGATAPSIIVDATTMTGTHAAQFSDNFNDVGNVTLAPGQSTIVTVTFAAASTGSKNAVLQIVHSGSNSPLQIPLTGAGSASLPGLWQSRPPSSLNRQEVAYIQVGGKFYLAGGSTVHEVYDPATQVWSSLTSLPADLDHIQAVTLGGTIYYVGGLIGWPGPASGEVYVYDPATDSFANGVSMTRPRGAGGVAVYNGKIYYAGGLNAGQAVPWFDVFDPNTLTWSSLPDMPVARDHFHAAVVGTKLYVTGGRNTSINATITSTIAFDFATGAWQTTGLAPLPTARGGFGAAVIGSEILIIGGEGGGTTFGQVEAYNTSTNTWRNLAPMPTSRHGIQAAVCNGGIYIAAGGTAQGGGQPSNIHEVLFPNGTATTCSPPVTPPSPLAVSPSSLAFGSVQVGQTRPLTVQVTHAGGATAPSIVVDATTITGAHAAQFSDNFNDAGNVTLAPGQSTTVTVTFAPSATGAKGATLGIVHTGSNSPLLLSLTGTGVAPPAPSNVRVNAGGPAVAGTPTWVADTAAAPSPYVNAAATGNKVHTTGAAISATHPSIPPGTPASLFQSERYVITGGPTMQWDVPVTPGTYQVRLYFAEIYFTTTGARIFNVSIEGTPVLQNYDIVADVGPFTGVVKSFVVTADTNLDIDLSRVTENPKISAIEIVPTASQPNQLLVSPSSLAFGSVLVGQSRQLTVQLSNAGGATAPNLVVDATTMTGTHAAQFSDNFNDAGNVTLAPGQSTLVTVTFAPDTAGTKTAALEITHSGNNSPAVVPVNGTATATPAGIWQTRANTGLARHEISYVHFNGIFYLTGDRGHLENQVYNAATDTWGVAATLPEEFHHSQAIELNGLIYYLGGLVGPYPDHVTPDVHIFDPTAGTWSEGTPMPAARARGGGGMAVYNGNLYVAGGLKDDGSGTGHEGVSVNLFDVYDPVAGTWTSLPNMPRARDHFHAAVVGNKLYAIAGRQGGDSGFFNAVIGPVDVYDFSTGTWSTLPASLNIPTPRAGTGAAVLGDEIIIIGGEGNGNAYNNVEAFNTTTLTWRSLAPMPTARHGIQAAVCNGGIYIAAGGTAQGGGQLSNIHEVLFPNGTATTCSPPVTPPSPLAVSPSSLAFGSVQVGQTRPLTVQVTHAGGATAPSIVVDATTITGAHAAQFSDNFNDAGNVTLAPGQSTTVTVTFAPSATGAKGATLGIVHTGSNSPLLLSLTGTGVAPPAPSNVRVNAGGPAVAGTPTWVADTAAAPSPYVNAAATGNKVHTTGAAISATHPSIPPGTPASLFQSERYVITGGPTMQWDVPVTPGTYQVRLYFAEIYFTTTGARIFNVSIEGTPVLQNYDIVADVGPFTGVVKSFVVTADTNLDIDLSRVTENPKISAIEIVPTASQPNQLLVSPSSLAFGSVLVGQSRQLTVQLSNAGGATAPNLVVDATTMTGTHAAQFSDNFNDAGNVTLAPGQSTLVTVTFAPSSIGDKTAQIAIVHSGTNSPLQMPLTGSATAPPIGFGKSMLSGAAGLVNPTVLQFGPDGRLYVGQQNGVLRVFSINRNAANSFSVTASETINLIQSVPNHDDNGALNAAMNTRLITGLLVTGTASQPVVYVAHSDPRIGGGPSGTDLNVDTNSSMISRLTKSGPSWQKLDLVRGLPRSEENHATNGMQLGPLNNVLYVAMGGNTNKGATSNNFAQLPEFALSAAVLSIDLTAIGNTTYDLPTLDDESRPGTLDANDPFGGNDGKNQGRLVPGGPVQVYAPGFRNPYDLVITQLGRLYTIDNGGNAGWGDVPVGEGSSGACTNAPKEPGTTSPDSLHLVTGAGYYGGHPNPTRGNTANTFNTSNPQSPVAAANPLECDYREAGAANGALATFPASTNGLTEYKTANFGGALRGDLLAASFSNTVYRIDLNDSGTQVIQVTPLFASVGSLPLDLQALGPGTPFPGTIWVGDYAAHGIIVFEPNDYGGAAAVCTGANDPLLDEDQDGYNNEDELDNGTSPCSAGDLPPDWDADFTSNRHDPDDDNDGVPDVNDPFAIDARNGLTTTIPVLYTWENDAPSPGGLFNLGFTGLMTNGSANYESQFDPHKMTAGGAAGVVTVDQVAEGDALGGANTQEYGFQFGVLANPATMDVFTVRTRVQAPFQGIAPENGQSMGLAIGTGDQDNYAKVVVGARSNGTGIEFVTEVLGVETSLSITAVPFPGPNYVDLYLRVDPDAATIQAYYSVTTDGVTGPVTAAGASQSVPASWFSDGAKGLAVGIISTSRGSAPVFPATWDFIEVVPGPPVP